jgi:hypothetical protein
MIIHYLLLTVAHARPTFVPLGEPSNLLVSSWMDSAEVTTQFGCGKIPEANTAPNECYDLGKGHFAVYYPVTDSCKLIDTVMGGLVTAIVGHHLPSCREWVLEPVSNGLEEYFKIYNPRSVSIIGGD